MINNIFEGIITALITPFKDDVIDIIALERLINFQIKSEVNALVVGGTTGEGSSLSEDEYDSLIDSACKIANKKMPIIAGIASVSTRYAIEKIKRAEQSGIDGIMLTVPHYIRPSQEGIIEHFRSIHATCKLPIMIYIHPTRTGVDLSDETILKIAELPRIVALKDAGEDVQRPLRLSLILKSDFNMLTGNDENIVAYYAHGGKGCVSVVSNVLPKECRQLCNYLAKSNFVEALELQKSLMPFYKALYAEKNPIGIKCAANFLEMCREEIRLPLIPAADKIKHEINNQLNKLFNKAR